MYGAAIEPFDFRGKGDVRAELLRLRISIGGKRMARNAGGKSQVVLDARAGTGLTARRQRIEHDHAQPFRRRIDRRRQPGRARADDRHIIDPAAIDMRQQPQARQHLRGIGTTQHRAIGADDERQIVIGGIELAGHFRRFSIGVDINHRVRIVVTPQERLQVEHGRIAPTADQRRPASTLDQRRAAQHHRLHDQLAERGLGHHQRAQARRAHDDGAHILDGDAVDEFGRARKLADFGQKIAGPVLGGQSAVTDAIALHDAHTPFDDEDHAIGRIPGTYHVLAGLPGLFPAIGRDARDIGGR